MLHHFALFTQLSSSFIQVRDEYVAFQTLQILVALQTRHLNSLHSSFLLFCTLQFARMLGPYWCKRLLNTHLIPFACVLMLQKNVCWCCKKISFPREAECSWAWKQKCRSWLHVSGAQHINSSPGGNLRVKIHCKTAGDDLTKKIANRKASKTWHYLDYSIADKWNSMRDDARRGIH